MRKDCAFTQSSKPGWCHLGEGYVVFAVRAGISWMNVLWEVRWESAWTPSSSQALLLLFPMAALLIFPNFCFGVYSLRSPFISTLPQTVWPFRVEDVLAVKLKGSWKGSRLMPKRSGLCSVDWQCKPCCIMLWGRSLICWNIGTLTDRCLSSASKVKVTN